MLSGELRGCIGSRSSSHLERLLERQGGKSLVLLLVLVLVLVMMLLLLLVVVVVVRWWEVATVVACSCWVCW